MTLKPLLLSLLALTISASCIAQCYMDRHSSTRTDAWLSCEESESPNPERGLGHWISYDLGEIQRLGQMHLWNHNHPDHLDDGMRTVFIDYSLNGQDWLEWGYFEFDRATGSGLYEGQEGPDFEGLETRYLMFTIRGNHGGECYGFSELRIDFEGPVNTEEVLAEYMDIDIYPNPTAGQATLNLMSPSTAKANMNILDATGKLVHQQALTVNSGENLVTLDLKGYDNGVYLVRVTSPLFDLSEQLTIISN